MGAEKKGGDVGEVEAALPNETDEKAYDDPEAYSDTEFSEKDEREEKEEVKEVEASEMGRDSAELEGTDADAVNGDEEVRGEMNGSGENADKDDESAKPGNEFGDGQSNDGAELDNVDKPTDLEMEVDVNEVKGESKDGTEESNGEAPADPEKELIVEETETGAGVDDSDGSIRPKNDVGDGEDDGVEVDKVDETSEPEKEADIEMEKEAQTNKTDEKQENDVGGLEGIGEDKIDEVDEPANDEMVAGDQVTNGEGENGAKVESGAESVEAGSEMGGGEVNGGVDDDTSVNESDVPASTEKDVPVPAITEGDIHDGEVNGEGGADAEVEKDIAPSLPEMVVGEVDVENDDGAKLDEVDGLAVPEVEMGKGEDKGGSNMDDGNGPSNPEDKMDAGEINSEGTGDADVNNGDALDLDPANPEKEVGDVGVDGGIDVEESGATVEGANKDSDGGVGKLEVGEA